METRVTQQQNNAFDFLGAIKALISLNRETSYQKTGQREETHSNSNTAEKAVCQSFPRTDKLWRPTVLLRLQELIHSRHRLPVRRTRPWAYTSINNSLYNSDPIQEGSGWYMQTKTTASFADLTRERAPCSSSSTPT